MKLEQTRAAEAEGEGSPSDRAHAFSVPFGLCLELIRCRVGAGCGEAIGVDKVRHRPVSLGMESLVLPGAVLALVLPWVGHEVTAGALELGRHPTPADAPRG